VIDAEALARAETVLQVAYAGAPDYGRQLTYLEIEREAFDNLLNRRVSIVKQKYPAWKTMDPVIEPAINTLLMHFFLVGIIAGRHAAKELV
jgi:hypothetical protein